MKYSVIIYLYDPYHQRKFRFLIECNNGGDKKLHRLNGPANEYLDNNKSYWVHGKLQPPW